MWKRKNSRADYNHATYPERFAEPEARGRGNLFPTSPLVPTGVEMKISRLAIPVVLLRSCAQRFCLGVFVAGMMAVGTAAELPGDESEHGVSLRSLADFDLETLLNMEVTLVSKKEQRLSQSAAAVSVISQEELRRSGATSIAESLRSVPGIEVGRLDSHTWAITARGFNEAFANKLLVMMDGRSVYTPLFSGVYWDVQDTLMEDIDRIEVIRGPGASLWGANAVNGVVNIITKSARETQGGLVVGGTGTEQVGFGSVRYGGRLSSNAYYRVYGKFTAHDSSATLDGAEADDAWAMGRGGFRVDWDATERSRLTLQGDVYDGDENKTITQFASTPPYRDYTAPFDLGVSGGNMIGRWKQETGEQSDLTVQAYYDHTEREFIVLKEDRDTFDLDVQHRFPLGERHEITWGTGYRLSSDAIESTFNFEVMRPQRDLKLFSGFVQDAVELIEDCLTLTLGSKVEHNDFTGVEFQPSGRLAWTPDPRHTVWVSASRAVRTPSRVEVDGRLSIDGNYTLIEELFPFLSNLYGSVQGNPEFASENLHAFELGYRVQPHRRLTFDAAAFCNVYDDLRSGELGAPLFEALPAPHFNLTAGNNMSGETYGAELAAKWQMVDWWRLSLSYSWLDIQLHTDSGISNGAQERAFEGGSPTHRVMVRSMMDLSRNVEFDAGVRHVGGIPRGGVPSYLVADVRLAWRPTPSLELSVVGQDLLDNRHREFSPDLIRFQETEVQRSVYAKITWKF